MTYQIKLGIIGCGALTEASCLPAVENVGGAKVTALVDKDLTRAQRLADMYGIEIAEKDYEKLVGKVDAVIVALPNWQRNRERKTL